MVNVMNDIDNTAQRLINTCLSSSKTSGADLRKAHYELGCKLGSQISKEERLTGKTVAVIIMMRAGMPFGMGIADSLDVGSDVDVLFSPIEQLDKEYDSIIIADAVINTGKTIFELIDSLQLDNPIIATNVISDKYIDSFNDFTVYSTRISSRSFKGSKTTTISNGKGPDTGDRLFNNSFFKDNDPR